MTTIRRDTETKNLRKTILKYSKDIPVVGERYRGVFSIVGYRVYDETPVSYHTEIDVVYDGEIKVSVSSLTADTWLSSDIKKNEKYRISPVKLNRFLKGSLYKSLNSHLAYFDTKISNSYSIKTIKWE
jgi:hypothetical protein